jgi:hypothetical protein
MTFDMYISLMSSLTCALRVEVNICLFWHLKRRTPLQLKLEIMTAGCIPEAATGTDLGPSTKSGTIQCRYRKKTLAIA